MPASPDVLRRLGRAYALLRHRAGDPYVRAAFFFVIALAAAWPALAKAGMLNDFRDAEYFTLFEEAARISVAKFHQLPLWDPYYCGGISGMGTPSARFASPTFVLTLLFGTLRADGLIAMTMILVGLEGTYRYVRLRGGGPLAALTVAPMFALVGFLAHSEALGWTNFYGFELVPWALYGTRRALRGSRRGLVVTALSVAWMIGLGGTYTAPLTVLPAALETLGALVRRARRPVRMLPVAQMALLVGLLAVAASLARLWPVAETLSASPRIIGGKGGYSAMGLLHALFGEKGGFVRAEFLIGLAAVPPLVLALRRKRAWPLLLSAGIWIWFALGFRAHPGLFALLRTVPPYTMLRAPERFLVFVPLFAAAIAAVGVRWLEAAGRKKPIWLAAAAACQILLLFDACLFVHNDEAYLEGRTMVAPPRPVAGDFRQARGNRWLAAYYPFSNRGTLSCFDDYDIAQSPDLRGDLAREEYLADPSAGTVKRIAWSPNRIDLHVELGKPARVLVNQNWHPGWRSSVGTVVDEDGLLAIDLPEGAHDVAVTFLPRWAVGGIGTSLLAFGVAMAIAWRARRGDMIGMGRDWWITAGLCAAPFVAAAASLLIHEPHRPPPPQVTPSGEPMVAQAPPEGAAPLGARLDGNVELEADIISTQPTGDGQGTMVSVELDWRLSEKLPYGLGVFIGFEGPDDKFNADHVLLSGVMPFEDAPVDVTVRDVADLVVLPRGDGESRWKVYAGIWRARRDGSRVRVVDRGHTKVNNNRVYLGSFVVP